MHYQPQKGSSDFQIYENKECLVDKKEKKTANIVTTSFFGQKITTAQN